MGVLNEKMCKRGTTGTGNGKAGRTLATHASSLDIPVFIEN